MVTVAVLWGKKTEVLFHPFDTLVQHIDLFLSVPLVSQIKVFLKRSVEHRKSEMVV